MTSTPREELHVLIERLHEAADSFERDLGDPYRRGVAHQRMRDLVDEIDQVVHAVEHGAEIDLREPEGASLRRVRVGHEGEG